MKKTYLLITALAATFTINAQTYLSKNFNDTSITSGGWTNNIVTGSADWFGADFGGEVFAKVTNWNGSGNDAAEVWMISPAFDLSTSNVPTLSFDSETNYDGDAIEVLVSIDYDGTSDPNIQGTWTALSPTLPTSTSSWSGWTASGDLDLSFNKGISTYIGFKYTGSASDGKTWEIDNIEVVESATGPVLSVSTTDATCGNSDGTATVSVTSGTTPYTYMWDNGSTDAMTTGLDQGSHSVTVTDGVGSSSIIASVGISNGPTVTVTSTDALCNGSSDGMATATGGLSDYTYMWENGSTNASASGLAAGTHSYTVTNGAGCTTAGTYSVGEPAAIVATASTTNETALGALDGSAIAAGTGGDGSYSFMWENGNTTSTLSGVSEGNYGITITDGNMCTGAAVISIGADYLALSTIYEIQYTAASNGESPLVDTEVMVKGVVSGFCTYDHPSSRNYRGYFIQDGDSAWSGLYVNDTVNYNGVSAGDTVTVIGTIREDDYPYWDYTVLREVTSFTLGNSGDEPTPVSLSTLDASNEEWEGVLVSISNATVNDDTDAQYGVWTVNDGTADLLWDNLMYWHSPDAQIGDKYAITGVMFSEFNDISIEPRRPSDVTFMGVGIDELDNASVNIYPNPTSGIIVIEAEGVNILTITNSLGQVVSASSINGYSVVDLSNQTKGIYFLELQSEGSTIVEKVVVK